MFVEEEVILWGNWHRDAGQDWERKGSTWVWEKRFRNFEFRSELVLDRKYSCLRYMHHFTNMGGAVLRGLNTQTCFHLVNAPEFISISGERLWASLDGRWTTTDQVPRKESPDPRRVWFLRQNLRSERSVVPLTGFPSAIMPEAATGPLFVAERFGAAGSVGIASRRFRKLFNNNDSILRCIHSESDPIATLEPSATASQEGVIVFGPGDHCDLVNRFEHVTRDWGSTESE